MSEDIIITKIKELLQGNNLYQLGQSILVGLFSLLGVIFAAKYMMKKEEKIETIRKGLVYFDKKYDQIYQKLLKNINGTIRAILEEANTTRLLRETNDLRDEIKEIINGGVLVLCPEELQNNIYDFYSFLLKYGFSIPEEIKELNKRAQGMKNLITKNIKPFIIEDYYAEKEKS